MRRVAYGRTFVFLVVRCFVVLLSAVVCGGVLKAGWFPYSSVVCLLLFSYLLPGCSLPWVFYCVLFTVIRVRIQKTKRGVGGRFWVKSMRTYWRRRECHTL